jgi:hypothetical protein
MQVLAYRSCPTKCCAFSVLFRSFFGRKFKNSLCETRCITAATMMTSMSRPHKKRVGGGAFAALFKAFCGEKTILSERQ